jgi:hypothetical protein
MELHVLHKHGWSINALAREWHTYSGLTAIMRGSISSPNDPTSD